jgi:ATP-dependent DNA ligase
MKFIKQCKGKDLSKVPASKLEDKFYASIKYDGNYVQIHKIDDTVHFYTSGGKQFYLEDMAEYLIEQNRSVDFILECEYIAGTSGKLGSRGECTCTTYRTLFNKGLPAYAMGNQFKCFDVIYYHNKNFDRPFIKQKYPERIHNLNSIYLGNNIEPVAIDGIHTLEECKELSKSLIAEGYEGIMAYSPDHIYYEGKRQNTSIKIKGRETADLKCIDVEEGEGKYTGLIGSLVLVDENGLVVSVGSGLNDQDRRCNPTYFIGQTIEIEYEQILDTYIQPTYKCIRRDK